MSGKLVYKRQTVSGSPGVTDTIKKDDFRPVTSNAVHSALETMNDSIRVGSIVMWTSLSLVPHGWMECDGRALSKTEYKELFDVIGYKYGGTGNLFNLPDARNRFPEGCDENLGQYIAPGIPNIKGHFGRVAYYGGSMSGAFEKSDSGASEGGSGSAKYYGTDFTAINGETKLDGSYKTADDYKVYGKSETVQPAAFTIVYIIKVQSVSGRLSSEAVLDDTRMTLNNVWSASKVNAVVGHNNLSIVTPGNPELDGDALIIEVTDPQYEVPVSGMIVRLLITTEIQSAVEINTVYLKINHAEPYPIKVMSNNSLKNVISSQLNGGADYNENYPHRWCDKYTKLELTFCEDDICWIVNSDDILLNHSSNNVGYIKKTNGLIEQIGTVNLDSSKVDANGSKTFDLYSLGYTKDEEGLYEIGLCMRQYRDGDHHTYLWSDIDGTGSDGRYYEMFGTTNSRHCTINCHLKVRRYVYVSTTSNWTNISFVSKTVMNSRYIEVQV